MNDLSHWLHKLFIPHSSNEEKPHVLRDASVQLFLFVTILCFTLSVAHQAIVRNTNFLAAVYSSALIDMANADRRAVSLSELRVSPLLQAAAELKAEDMAAKGYFAHYSPEGVSPWYWMRQAGYSYIYAGENLAIDFSDSAPVESAWMNSPTHRANLLNGKYTEIGIATREGVYQGRQTTFVVEMFGRPKVATQTLVRKGSPLAASVGPVFDLLVSNPHYLMEGVYALLATILIFGLIGFASVEWKKHHFKHILYGFLLLFIISIFSFIYFSFVYSPVVIRGLA